MSPAKALDQFYTARPIAQACFDFLLVTLKDAGLRTALSDVFLEPSAGEGAFFDCLPDKQRVGIDLMPKHPEVMRADFLEDFQPKTGSGRWFTVGNPPFGKNSSLAVRFFNKAARFSEVIAFVVPMTFCKQSLQRRLDPHFELIGQKDLPLEAFEFEGRPYSVPCCFQVWRRSKVIKKTRPQLPLTHADFDFCSPEEADFAIRRVGGLAGKVIRKFAGYSKASHYYLRSNIGAEKLASRFEALSWDDVKWNTAGNPSISKRELVAKYGGLTNNQLLKP